MRFSWRAPVVAVFLATPLACGDDAAPSAPSVPTTSSVGVGGGGGPGGAGSTGGGGAPPGECAVLSPLDTSLFFGTWATFGLSARVDAPLGGYAKTRLTLELYGWETPLTTGAFDLSVAPDDSYATCTHCVLLVAYDELDQPRRAFFQQSGTMAVSKLDENDFNIAAGSVEDARLVEVTQNPDLSWNVVPGGLCFDVPSWSFDTTPVDGGACERVEDCPNEAYQTCDVETGTCQAGECSLFGDPPVCDAGYRCLSQVGPLVDREESGPALGACYEDCDPEGPGARGSCDVGSTCFALDSTQAYGFCLEVGGPALGEACDLPDLGTGCAAGALCAGEPPICQAICDYLTPESGCPADTYCSLLNLCEPLQVGDVAPVGALCAPGAATLTDCGPEGDAFRGLCYRMFEAVEDAVCTRLCRTADQDCPGGQSCIGIFQNPHAGICIDAGECGDGTVDLLRFETCDDGNTQSGDGCSGDCTTAELGPLCALATPLVAGQAVVGTNEAGVTGYTSQCDPFNATPVATYAFVPSAPGELTLTLQSVADLGLSVLGDCLDGASELGCRVNEGDDVLHVNFATVPAGQALIVVRGAMPLETGLFILQSEFVVAACGDGLVGGPEACDDGNVVGGDGCAADCSAIEWPQLCASLPTIADGAVVQGTLANGAAYFDLTAICSFESGRDRAYSFVAPSAGTLTVSLTSDENLSVFLRDDCGPADELTYLSCGNSGHAGETETAAAQLEAGQLVTVVVDGFTREDGGAFALTATFTP